MLQFEESVSAAYNISCAVYAPVWYSLRSYNKPIPSLKNNLKYTTKNGSQIL